MRATGSSSDMSVLMKWTASLHKDMTRQLKNFYHQLSLTAFFRRLASLNADEAEVLLRKQIGDTIMMMLSWDERNSTVTENISLKIAAALFSIMQIKCKYLMDFLLYLFCLNDDMTASLGVPLNLSKLDFAASLFLKFSVTQFCKCWVSCSQYLN